MPQDLLASGISWLAGQLRQNASEPVTYARGAQSATLRATLGKTLLKLLDEHGGSRVEWTDRDYLIVAADFAAAGFAGDPQRGDTVTGADGVRYEVLPYADEPPWRWSDPFKTIYRVHAKLVG